MIVQNKLVENYAQVFVICLTIEKILQKVFQLFQLQQVPKHFCKLHNQEMYILQQHMNAQDIDIFHQKHIIFLSSLKCIPQKLSQDGRKCFITNKKALCCNFITCANDKP